MKLKLIKGASYTGIVSATKRNPYVIVDDEATVQKAVASGYFKIIEDFPASEPQETPLMDMSLSGLKSLARDKGIETAGLRTKAEYADAIAAADAPADADFVGYAE